MEIKFDDHVALPASRNHLVEKTLRKMKLQQSFIDPMKRDANVWRDCANRLGMKITARRQPDGLYRIWRIE